ncbi:MAG: hypothetical protein OMM_11587 [Candidatus Magnetoglobus multicellularis str. Araruama]|uniref:DUF2283 domain-containing protein n=1 Tax=Candidatus Magnetoglobus multicellularis str. Araruama TaxID=890399 RepID=A0A1V1NXZ0_9BACT|nr:MAG: hypothetical protein OMM_11587 [Candidatus Magnetoglobus multicellularis str. Araruama]
MDASINEKPIITEYDTDEDIYYLCFSDKPREAIAEEAGEDVFVRFVPDTNEIVTIEFLNFRSRLENLFGKEFIFKGSEMPELLLAPQLSTI